MIKATEMLFEWDFRFLDFNCNEFESINIVKARCFTGFSIHLNYGKPAKSTMIVKPNDAPKLQERVNSLLKKEYQK